MEKVNHPKHYNAVGRKECWDEFEANYGTACTYIWCLMTAQKYLYRMGLKKGNPIEQEIAKAEAYLKHAEELQDYRYPINIDNMKQMIDSLYENTKDGVTWAKYYGEDLKNA